MVSKNHLLICAADFCKMGSLLGCELSFLQEARKIIEHIMLNNKMRGGGGG